MRAIERAIKSHPVNDSLLRIEAQPVETRWIESVHTPDYRQFIEEICLAGKGIADTGDTHVCPKSYHVARLSAGAAVGAVDAVGRGVTRRAFACARPPGHHARVEAAMGFCLFNNVAIAARYAQLAYGWERIFILDWDVHHGNGTQERFYADPTVFFCSLHQHPHYPGTGHPWEDGSGKGRGTTLNLPFPSGSTWADYQTVYAQKILPALDSFHPDLILISAGFDAHRDDPLGGIQLVEADFAEFTRLLCAAADKLCKGRMISVLEGGYHLTALGKSVVAHLEAMEG